jgi:uncharacterized membrane protein
MKYLKILNNCTFANKKVGVLLILFLYTMVLSVAQCPMCKASVESSQRANTKSVGMGLNYGIFILLGSVYIIICIVGVMFYRYYKKSSLQNV